LSKARTVHETASFAVLRKNRSDGNHDPRDIHNAGGLDRYLVAMSETKGARAVYQRWQRAIVEEDDATQGADVTGASDATLDDFERRFGVTLPTASTRVIPKRNGSASRTSVFNRSCSISAPIAAAVP
jgi:hypothetical protein